MRTKQLRIGGMLAAAGMLLAQLASFPVQAASQTTKSIDSCEYFKQYDPALTISKDAGADLSLSGLGVPADKTVTEVWIDVTLENKGIPAMPAVGYSCPGYVNSEGKQTDWYGEGLWMQNVVEHSVIVIYIPDDAPMPDQFSVQIWGDPGDTVDEMQLNGIGFVTEDGGGDIGMMTRKGDVNTDKTVNIDDAMINCRRRAVFGAFAPAAGQWQRPTASAYSPAAA
jgi:hypothetical protein